MKETAFTLESMRVRLPRYQAVLMLAWFAFLCLQITRPCCEAMALLMPHGLAAEHHYKAEPHDTESRAALAVADGHVHAHHPHPASEDDSSPEKQAPTPHCESPYTPQGELLVYSCLNKTLDEPKQIHHDHPHRLTILAVASSIGTTNPRHHIPPTYPPPYLVTQRLRI
ncbi:MAG: hypothetical protein J5I92_17365 [Thiogranum sp.]|nr:hypothetical protein [Thiogranum sp.]